MSPFLRGGWWTRCDGRDRPPPHLSGVAEYDETATEEEGPPCLSLELPVRTVAHDREAEHPMDGYREL